MPTRGDRRPAEIMVIEVAGAPGAGKTSLVPAILHACGAAGLRPFTVEQAARVFARRTPAGRLAAYLPPQPRDRALWMLFYVGSALAAAHLASRRPAMAAHVARSQWRRPCDADIAERRVIYWYFRTAGAYAFLRRHGRPGEVIIIDEGFVHRAVQLHASAVERPDRRQIARYVDALPPSDLLVVVRAPAQVCQRRVRERGVWRRLAHRDGREIDRFVANAHCAVELAADAVRAGGAPMIEVDNTSDPAAAEATVTARIEAALCPTARRAPSCTVPRIRLPRPARLVDHLSSRREPPGIAPEICEEILGHYGLTLEGPPTNVAFGRRNSNVIVRTSVDRMVLRRYRRATPHRSVAHEHDVLTELERRGFPAVRLQRTSTADTVVTHRDDLYALFEFEHGANLSAYMLPGRGGRAAILSAAGRTLARLHHELAEFRPAASHHLGYDAASGTRIHGLDWYLETLAALPKRTASPGAAVDHHYALAARAPQIAAELTALHEALAEAHLPQVMIHGDFGVHNLLFRRDGVAVVGDFELARREWRLVDLVIVLSRIPRRRARAFIDGYRWAAAIPTAEWARLADVWRYHRLTGAVHSWNSYFSHDSDQRLAAAWTRVTEAQQARARVASLWA